MGRASGELKLLAPSGHVFLHSSTPRPPISVLPSLHSPRSVKCELQKQQLCPETRGYGRALSRLWLKHSSLRDFQVETTDDTEPSSSKVIRLGQVATGRCALVSTAALLLVQCASGEGHAIAAAYTPAVVGQQYSSMDYPMRRKNTAGVGPQYSSVSMDSLGTSCNVAPMTSASTSFTKKIRGTAASSHATLGLGGKDGVARQFYTALRKPVSLVKRSGSRLPRLLATNIVCTSVGALPIGSISAATLTNLWNSLARLSLALDWSILRSSFGTSVNLLSLCTLVVWMQRSGQLPPDTPVILSQVAFRLFIPCFLMSKVATTLTNSSASNLVALPLMAIVQVIVGAILGRVASHTLFKVPSFQPAGNWAGDEGGDASLSPALLEDQLILSRAAIKKQALITAACAFGNSLTLPLVFLSGVLATAEEANRAAGYLALYMVGWSPAMWSVGYKILTEGDEVPETESDGEQSIWRSFVKFIQGVMNPPLYGVLVGLLIGGTPLSHLFLGGEEGTVLATTSAAFDTMGVFAKLRTVTAGILSPLFEAVTLLGTATLAVQTVVLATSLGASLPKPGEKFGNSPPSGDDERKLVKVELDIKAIWVISLVRLILLPVSGILVSCVLQFYHMLPPDPIYRLVILAESAMPTAQNLVLLAQLNAGTRPLAGMLASLLLRQYALSVFPITVWMAIFLTFTPVS